MASNSDTDSAILSGQESDTGPTSTPEPEIPDDPIYEARLFAKFPGYLHSQKVRPSKAWSWKFGYDISKGDTRIWVCKMCIKRNSHSVGSFAFRGTQNHVNHLFNSHSISAPEGQTKARLQKKVESRASSREPSRSPSLTSYFGLNPENPREQAIANTFIKSFDKQEFKKGPIGKLHNIVICIHRSDKLTNKLRQIQITQGALHIQPSSSESLDVVIDNETRWLSQYYMIKRAVILRSTFRLLIQEFRDEWTRENTLKSGRLKKNAKKPIILEDDCQLTDHDWRV